MLCLLLSARLARVDAQPAIDDQPRAVDIPGTVRGQEDHGVGNLVHLSPASGQNALLLAIVGQKVGAALVLLARAHIGPAFAPFSGDQSGPKLLAVMWSAGRSCGR